MFGSILLLFLLPWLDNSPVRSGNYRPVFKRFFWILVVDVIVLAWVGGGNADTLHVALGQIATAYYFAHFLIILPLVSRNEDTLAAAVVDLDIGAAWRAAGKRADRLGQDRGRGGRIKGIREPWSAYSATPPAPVFALVLLISLVRDGQRAIVSSPPAADRRA